MAYGVPAVLSALIKKLWEKIVGKNFDSGKHTFKEINKS